MATTISRLIDLTIMLIDQSTLNNHWNCFEYVSLDLEGTGPQHQEQEGIVDIAGVLILGGRVTDDGFRRLLNPEISIPEHISRIHGIYDKDVGDKPCFSEVCGQIEQFLSGRILIAHNASVERRVLRFKMPSYSPAVILDTLKLSRSLYPEHKKHGLDELIGRFDLISTLQCLGEHKRHSAYYDAYATAHAFVKMVTDRLDGKSLGDLMKLCALESNIQPDSSPDQDDAQGNLFQ